MDDKKLQNLLELRRAYRGTPETIIKLAAGEDYAAALKKELDEQKEPSEEADPAPKPA